MSAQPPAPQDEQPETVSPAPHPAAKKLPIPAIIAITAVVGLVIGLAGGIGGMYLYTTPIIDNLRESYSQSEAKAQTLTEQRNELSGQVETLQQQVDELKPQANEGSSGLTILERNVRDTNGNPRGRIHRPQRHEQKPLTTSSSTSGTSTRTTMSWTACR